ncbi:phage antirepressor N-terminal domain-containing protein [Corynebacterium pseudokroppenstedtii]|uniref:Phage antirepressor N-terminal domain-containing protein n=1 Tax=Corynebacterium pseudokroppenstedtii TaxID=2804917 RepID=A0AAU0PW00_9CORY|nr:phage antirepressor N-terminal domain-containing protein [Corynebacterium pseudokroppenstedtii]MCF8703317.1 phage antirepressor N-terminal domain-containing protein [Corynebacterium pseudokroppenstedtii]MCG2636828.1 phage antirepressor N-terminal domain-containing protein [Corynebacterium pseudokroppenstedtii]
MNELEIIDFHGTRLPVVEVEGEPRVCLHRAFSAIGLDADRQVRNLRKRPWADIKPTAVTAVYAGQEHVKNMITSDVRTFLMALATIPVTRVAEHVRPILVAYQCEVARVIEKHFMRKRGEDLTNPHTFTWDEVSALLAQRYGMDLDTTALLRVLRDGGVLKQTNAPRKKYRDWFWFTGSAWNVHPHILPKLARSIAETRKVLGDLQAVQLEIQLNNAIAA